jgi:hypothetical protein
LPLTTNRQSVMSSQLKQALERDLSRLLYQPAVEVLRFQPQAYLNAIRKGYTSARMTPF